MSRGVNTWIGIGNLGKDPECRTTASGTAVANFSLAVGERVKKNGEWVDDTTWLNITCFGKVAENVGKYTNKGSTVYIEGRIQNREWTDKEGHQRKTTEIVANNVQFLGGKEKARVLTETDPGFDPNEGLPDFGDDPF